MLYAAEDPLLPSKQKLALVVINWLVGLRGLGAQHRRLQHGYASCTVVHMASRQNRALE